MDAMDALRGWGTEEDEFALSSSEGDAQAFTAVAVDRKDDVRMTLEKVEGDPRVRLSCRVAATPADVATAERLTSAAARVEAGRSGTTVCRFEADPPGVRLEALIYEDGLTRHALNAAVLELRRARRLLDDELRALGGALVPADEGKPERPEEPVAAAEPEPVAAAAAEPLALSATVVDTPSASPQAQPAAAEVRCSSCGTPLGPDDAFCPSCGTPRGPSVATPAASIPTPAQAAPAQATPAQATVTPAPVAAQPAFVPTHVVPPNGMAAWAKPDPNSPTVAQLGGSLPLQVTEVLGAWAHVTASNGWTGWVDARLLLPRQG